MKKPMIALKSEDMLNPSVLNRVVRYRAEIGQPQWTVGQTIEHLVVRALEQIEFEREFQKTLFDYEMKEDE